jgi:hypothetical protein
MSNDFLVTRIIDDFREALTRLGYHPKFIDDVVQHENAHFETAQQFGYDPTFVITDTLQRITDTCTRHDYGFGIRLPKPIKPQHMIDICLAPSNPSITDYDTARRYGWTGEALRK